MCSSQNQAVPEPVKSSYFLRFTMAQTIVFNLWNTVLLPAIDFRNRWFSDGQTLDSKQKTT